MTQQPYGPPPGQQYPPYPGGPFPGQDYPPGYPGQQPQGPPPGQFPGQVSPQEFQQGYPPAGPPPGQHAPGPSGADPFTFTPPSGGGNGVGMEQLIGRLLLIQPSAYDPNAQGMEPGQIRPKITADLVVCDGDPIIGQYNGKTRQLTPYPTGPRSIPAYFGGVWIRGDAIVPQLVDHVAGRQFFLGRLVLGQGQKGSPPKLLTEPTEADRAMARGIHARWEELKAASRPAVPDQFSSAPGQQGPPPAYGQPQGSPQGYGAPQYKQPQGAPYQPPAQYQQGPPQGPPPNWGGQQ